MTVSINQRPLASREEKRRGASSRSLTPGRRWQGIAVVSDLTSGGRGRTEFRCGWWRYPGGGGYRRLSQDHLHRGGWQVWSD